MKSCLALIAVFYLVNQLPKCQADDYIREAGYCMWYGQCGTNPFTQKPINCLYNKPAKPVDGQESHVILAELCPEFSHPDSKVCCDHAQVVSLQTGLQSAQQMMSRCPACWKNFRELYCRMTCSPNNSLFIDPALGSNKSIVSIYYYVEKAFRDGLYNSCKNVVFPSSNEKIMNFLCGTTADKCNALKFLTYMGDPQLNGVSPFKIDYTGKLKKGIKPMYVDVKLCNESFFDPFTNSTMQPCSSCSRCSCEDRPASGKAEYLTAKIIFSLKPSSDLNKRTCYRNFFTPPGECVLTGTILRHGILNKILQVQTHLMNLSGENNLGDFCLKSTGSSSRNSCTVMSVLQYWQNDAEKLKKCVPLTHVNCSSGGLFTAFWGDHLASCIKYAINFRRLSKSCATDVTSKIFIGDEE